MSLHYLPSRLQSHGVLSEESGQRFAGLTTVTAGRGKPSDTQPSAAYALVSAKADPAAGIFPSEPGQIVREYSPLVQPSLPASSAAIEWRKLRIRVPDRFDSWTSWSMNWQRVEKWKRSCAPHDRAYANAFL